MFVIISIAITLLVYFIGHLPVTRTEKDILRNLIKESCSGEEDDGNMEENFVEAIHYVNTCIGQQRIPSNVQVLLDDERCTNITQGVKILTYI